MTDWSKALKELVKHVNSTGTFKFSTDTRFDKVTDFAGKAHRCRIKLFAKIDEREEILCEETLSLGVEEVNARETLLLLVSQRILGHLMTQMATEVLWHRNKQQRIEDDEYEND